MDFWVFFVVYLFNLGRFSERLKVLIHELVLAASDA